MAYKIVIKVEARIDTQEAYDYYELEKADLGEDFLNELAKTYRLIAQNPSHYGYIDARQILRDIKVHRFPFTAIFEITEQEVIIYAVHNTWHHPKKRLRK